MRPTTILLIFALGGAAPAAAQPVVVGSFECQAPGAMSAFPWAPDCEGWDYANGAAVLPDGVTVTVGCAGFPTHGSRWAEVTSTGLGPGPFAPPGGPGPGWGTLDEAELRMPVMVPTFPSGQARLSVDWYWMTSELQNGSSMVGAPCPCNDYSQIAVFGPMLPGMTFGSIEMLFVDTYAPYVITPGNSCPSSVAGATLPNYASLGGASVQTASVLLPPGWIGRVVTIRILTVNGGDDQYESALYVDNLRFEDPVIPFSLTATTSGGGAGDLLLDVQGFPSGSTGVLILCSATPATYGPGSGPVFGLVPDAVFLASVSTPQLPFHPLHFPAGATPYALGPFVLPSGTLAILAGQTWETTAVAYDLAAGLLGQSNFQSLAW